MDQVKDHIEFGSKIVEYTIEYRSRKTLGIYVHPDGRVEVKAPMEASLEQIRNHVHRRAPWIYKQQRYFDSLGIHTPERRYVSGESHLYLGRQYMLRVIDSERNEVHYKGNILEVECRHRKYVRTLLMTWYRQRAEIKFREYATPLIARFGRYGVQPTGITLKECTIFFKSSRRLGDALARMTSISNNLPGARAESRKNGRPAHAENLIFTSFKCRH